MRVRVLFPAVATFVLLHFALPARAQAPSFADRPKLVLTPHAFSDREVVRLSQTLDALLPAASRGEEPWQTDAREPLAEFARQLQFGRLSAVQQTQVLAHLDAIAQAHPLASSAVSASRQVVRTLGVGKTAPEIVGRDLDGTQFRLSDYRGRVVVLMFSADWCAICRTLEPYERLMLELYKNWPFAIVSVETGTSRDGLKRQKAQNQLTYRSWWDEPGPSGTGPIAEAWGATGFPRLYLLDARGVIRFVDLRYEDLLKGVRQLLDETLTPPASLAVPRTAGGAASGRETPGASIAPTSAD